MTLKSFITLDPGPNFPMPVVS